MRNIFRRRGLLSSVFGIIVLIFAVGLLLHQARAQQAGIPSDLEIPSGISITPPGPSAPKEIAGFSGMWVGLWNGSRSTALIVTALNGDNAKCFYCWGSSPDAWKGASGGGQAGCRETFGTISHGELNVVLGGKAEARYRLNEDGTLAGIWQGTLIKLSATLRRVQYP